MIYPRYIRTLIYCCIIGSLWCCQQKLPEEVAQAYETLPETVDYNYHVKPILSDRCFACHGQDNNTREADLRLDTEEGAYTALESGKKAFVPGSWNKSHALQRMLSDDPELVMPPPESNLSLTDEEIATIAKWVEQGAEYKPHWAFIPPSTPEVPESKQFAEFIKNPIDNFVAATLESRGLSPSKPANKQRLLRRVTLDLTGLPPTIEEMDAFLADDSEGAYEKVVDRLLASSAYGERMAMEWMDVSRYADSHGMHADGARTMWPWRDWVIKAFNENLPYDQFATWQLAGDLLPDANREQKLATAFHRNHPMTGEGGVVDEEFRLKYVFDRSSTTATVFLGLTLECAQCHDHKFDPLSQKDYYSMAAFFNNVRELGMTGDDGDYGPMLLLPSDPQKQTIDSLDDLTEQLKGDLAEIAQHKESLVQYLDQLSGKNTVAVPQPVGYFPVEQMSSTKDAKGNSYRTIDHNPKTRISSEPQLVNGTKGQALHFDDGYETLALKEIGQFEINEPFTASVWVKPDVDQKIQTIMATAGDKNNFWRGWEFYLDSTNHPAVKLIHSLPHNMVHTKSLANIPVGEWSHLAFTYDGGGKAANVNIYVNGRSVATNALYDRLYKSIRTISSGNHQPTNQPIQLGKSYRAFTGEFGIYKGAVDEIHVFHQDLTPLEIAQLYNRVSDKKIAQDELPEEAKITHVLKRKHQPYQKKQQQLRDLVQQRMEVVDDVTEIMVMEEEPEPRPMFVLDRGAYDAPTEQVPPATPGSVLQFPEDLSRDRLGLAKWLFSEENPLTARVTVNRYWQLIFGRGIVDTPHDFGFQGSLPSHPELLDWLAVTFRESGDRQSGGRQSGGRQSGWDVKGLIKTMVMSGTYRQASVQDENQVKDDPDNIWLARGPSQRLPAEIIRDNALAASGLLVEKIGGASVKPYQPEGLWIEKGSFSHELLHYKEDEGDSLYRRSLYTFIRRTSPHPAMVAFDAPNRDVCTVKRESTNTPLQALVLLNDPQFVEAARVMGQRVLAKGGETTDEKINYGFRLATGRKPTTQEVDILEGLFTEAKEKFSSSPAQADSLLAIGEYPVDQQLDRTESAAWAMIASTLLNHDEFYTKR
ncbi:DUF1553 domain-containing protein [Tunicatimonas pelagia]|uniref:DUF1553 domain-containing protein n=1 Tax=Tunicatimonas pelagia TaxID=931531 RepID=UPI0026650AE3|nr:DUF1553 domain-containing protein [Tunicatimonas pelagia]WKN44661.1 DUF1553 domain-containing protein [Tunicatimonas pelagia]